MQNRRRIAIAVVIIITCSTIIVTGCTTESEESAKERSTPPPALLFSLKNADEILTEDDATNTIVTVELYNGRLPLDDIAVRVSPDNSTYAALTILPAAESDGAIRGISPLGNNEEPIAEWNYGETVVITEAEVPLVLLDEHYNWPTTDLYLMIENRSSDTVVFFDHTTLEPSMKKFINTTADPTTVEVPAPDPSTASNTTSSIVVTVRDSHNTTVRDAAVQLDGHRLTNSTRTDAAGRARFENITVFIPPSTIDATIAVSIEKDGYKPLELQITVIRKIQ